MAGANALGGNAVSVSAGALLDLNGYSQTIRSLSGSGFVEFDGGTLTISSQIGAIGAQLVGSLLADRLVVNMSASLAAMDYSGTLFSNWSTNDVFAVNGNALANTITGTSRSDLINGLGGNDQLEGGLSSDTLNGGAGNDRLFAMTAADPNGSGAVDQLFGDAGNDTLTGSSVGDSLFGGGGYDRAVYTVPRSAATILHNADGTKSISVAGYTDRLNNVEVAAFSDGTLVSLRERTSRNDLAGDGASDVLLRNSADGSIYVWETHTGTLGSGSFGWTPGADWKARGTGDFNGDGKSDVLLQHAGSGQCFVWLSGGIGGPIGAGSVGWAPGANWVARGTGDFDGDGKSDILIQDTTNGQCFAFFLDGTGVIGAGLIGGAVGANYVVRATGDFNGDGKTDIAFQETGGGQNYVWNLNGTSIVSHGAVGWAPGAVWVTRGVGDFNLDGKSDLLLQNTANGQCFTFMVDGTSSPANALLGPAPGADWVAKGPADFNGDGLSDLMFQNAATGQVVQWYFNLTTLLAGGGVGWTPGAQWEAVA